jgi:hypothetical protein
VTKFSASNAINKFRDPVENVEMKREQESVPRKKVDFRLKDLGRAIGTKI